MLTIREDFMIQRLQETSGFQGENGQGNTAEVVQMHKLPMVDLEFRRTWWKCFRSLGGGVVRHETCGSLRARGDLEDECFSPRLQHVGKSTIS